MTGWLTRIKLRYSPLATAEAYRRLEIEQRVLVFEIENELPLNQLYLPEDCREKDIYKHRIPKRKKKGERDGDAIAESEADEEERKPVTKIKHLIENMWWHKTLYTGEFIQVNDVATGVETKEFEFINSLTTAMRNAAISYWLYTVPAHKEIAASQPGAVDSFVTVKPEAVTEASKDTCFEELKDFMTPKQAQKTREEIENGIDAAITRILKQSRHFSAVRD